MADPQNETKINHGENQTIPQSSVGIRRKEKKTFAMKVFELILRYKHSAIFQWVNRNYVLSLVIVTVWGMVIVGVFLFMLIYNILKYTSR
ncbi:MAG: hypothetical protein N2316_06275 [Spirochaetes bacterium]|nr:hypothetical protein [Spirochaetota bacterium]